VLLLVSGSIGCRGPAPAPVVLPPPQAKAPEPALPPLHLLLRVGERRLYMIDDDPGTPVESFPIAVGRKGHETPIGKFSVIEKVEHPYFDVVDPNDRTRLVRTIPPGPANPLGERWIGFFRDDAGVTGIHGTPHPELLGKAVSGGCIRMRNTDVVRIYERVAVGTPVIIEP
jgi:lipoprotein-anchoring transpeptidase ErfK/SrfK